MAFHVHLTNFGYDLAEPKHSLDDAIAYGKSKGFDFTVKHNKALGLDTCSIQTVYSYSVIGGGKHLK